MKVCGYACRIRMYVFVNSEKLVEGEREHVCFLFVHENRSLKFGDIENFQSMQFCK